MPVEREMKNQETLPRVFLNQAEKKRGEIFLIHHDGNAWRERSWEEVAEKVKHLSMGLMGLGVRKGDRVSAISETRPELAYACMAIANAGAIFSPIYHTNSPVECTHVIKDSGAKIAFAENPDQVNKLKKAWQDLPPFEWIIVFEGFQADEDPRIISLDRLEELGKEELARNGEKAYFDRIDSVRPEDVSTIIYTSGTTGPPKGVMDTNEGIIRSMNEFARLFPVSKKEKGISFLPMAHALELRNGHWYHVYHGFPQIYAQSMASLFSNIREMGPTFIFTTPRFLEKHYNTFRNYIDNAPPLRRRMIEWSLRAGLSYQNCKENGGKGLKRSVLFLSNQIGCSIFLRRARKEVGSELRFIHVGGAPMSQELLDFFRACGLPTYQGYGQTEAPGFLAVGRPGASKYGSAGKPPEGVELSFTDDGEILVKGWSRCKGYWNDEKATAELFRDGFLHTGDLGFLDDEGYLHITGRKKDILITSSGKNISPSNIENLLKMSRYISQAIVFGEGKTYLTAVITLYEEEIMKYAQENNISCQGGFKELTQHPAILDLIQTEIAEKNKELSRIEQIRKFTILEEELSQQNGELTPTMKVKRNVVAERHKKKVEAMYA